MGFPASKAGAGSAVAGPNYDEQMGITFAQDLTAIAYNVTALAQVDADGYGPAYILNGLTALGYWYQVGVSYHWPTSGGGYSPAFGFSYQVYGPNGRSVFPTNGGAGLDSFSKAVNSGDSVLLSLTFSGSSVRMLAQDWDTGATAETSYASEGSSSFVGDQLSPSNSHGFFSGLMTEWYHVLPYMGNIGKVTYTNQAVALSSAWMWIDEIDTGNSNSAIFNDQTMTPVAFTNDQQVYPFASHGVTMYSSAHQLITGLLNTTLSRASFVPYFAEAAPPMLTASYTLAGLQQSSELVAGTGTLIEADPGTSVTVSIDPSGSSAPERWVFGGTGASEVAAVTFAAGSNVTYAYYHVVEQTVAYRVADGGNPLPATSAPELVHEEPPPGPSATPAAVVVRQLLGTSPIEISVLVGSVASLNGTIPGSADERWAADPRAWTVSGPNSIPSLIQFYDQYQVSIGYSIVGGGTPPEPPEFDSTSLGIPAIIPLSGGATTAWFDAGSGYSFTSVLNGSTPGERWVRAGGLVSGAGAGNFSVDNSPVAAPPAITNPGEAISWDYKHQYYAALAVNDVRGGVVSQGSGWLDAGSTFNASASANPQWQFEGWDGSGASSYTGTNPSIGVAVTGPFSEKATFYVQLSIAADPGTNVAFSYASGAGTVPAGSTKTLYLSPSTNVTLRASPSLFVYSFGSWKETGLANATKPSLSLVVDSPLAVAGTSTYDYPLLLGMAAAVTVVVLAGTLWIGSRRRSADLGDFARACQPASPAASESAALQA
jgi:hypothetical protein